MQSIIRAQKKTNLWQKRIFIGAGFTPIDSKRKKNLMTQLWPYSLFRSLRSRAYDQFTTFTGHIFCLH